MARKTIASLNIQVGATTGTLRRDMAAAVGEVRRFDRSVGTINATLGSFGSRLLSLTRTVATFLGITGGLAGIGFAVNLAADLERTEVAFKTMLGSGEQAKRLLEELQQFAASTPFQLPELQGAAQLLLAFNEPAATLVETLRSIGDIASGVNAPIGELAELFGKARVQGRLFQEDINQLTGRGIPIIQELAKQFGVAESAVRDLVSSGKVNFGNLERAFKSLTAEGGKFFGLMAAQSNTLHGTISTLKDNVAALFIEIGTALLPILKETADAALHLTEFLRGLDAETVSAVAQVVAFSAAFAAVVFVVPKVVAAIRAVITAIRSFTAVSIIAQSVANPLAAAKVLAGLAAGAGAAYLVGQAFDQFADSAAGAAQAADRAASSVAAVAEPGVAKGLRDAAAAAGELGEGVDEVAAAVERAKAVQEEWLKIGERITENFKTPAEQLRAEFAEISEALARGVISWETYERALSDVADRFLELEANTPAFEGPTRVGAAVRRTTEGFSAVQSGQDALRALLDASRRSEAMARRREQILEALLAETREIRAAGPIRVTATTVRL